MNKESNIYDFLSFDWADDLVAIKALTISRDGVRVCFSRSICSDENGNLNFSNDLSVWSMLVAFPQSYDSNNDGNFRLNCFSSALKLVSSFGNTNSPHCGHATTTLNLPIDKHDRYTIERNAQIWFIPKRKSFYIKNTLIRTLLFSNRFHYEIRYNTNLLGGFFTNQPAKKYCTWILFLPSYN